MRGPVDIHQGTADQVVDPAWATKIDRTLRSEGVTSTLHEYPDLGHLLDLDARTVVSSLYEKVVSPISKTAEFFDQTLRLPEH